MMHPEAYAEAYHPPPPPVVPSCSGSDPRYHPQYAPQRISMPYEAMPAPSAPPQPQQPVPTLPNVNLSHPPNNKVWQTDCSRGYCVSGICNGSARLREVGGWKGLLGRRGGERGICAVLKIILYYYYYYGQEEFSRLLLFQCLLGGNGGIYYYFVECWRGECFYFLLLLKLKSTEFWLSSSAFQILP